MRNEVTFFDDQSTDYRKEYDRETTDGYSFRIRREKVAKLIPEAGVGATVLDIACGPGIMIGELLQKGYTVTAADAAPEMVARAAEEYGSNPRVRLDVADVYDLPYPNASFDVVTAMGLVEYLDDEAKAYKEMTRVLKPGGLLIVTYPYKWSPWRLWNRALMFTLGLPRKAYKKLTGKKGHYVTHREYVVDEIFALYRKYGITPERAVFYNFKLVPFPLDQWLPRLTVKQSKALEHLDGSLFRSIGTAFIVSGRKV